jgi:group I intron endonuclease
MRISGIYKILSKIKPERCYIGSAISLENRKRDHFRDLRQNKHSNKILQHHYNKYGINDLQFIIILFCKEIELIEAEQFFIDSYNPYFNICKIAGNSLGYKHTSETKEKFHKRKISEETRKKLSEAHKGKESHMKGKTASKETREKQRLAKLGKKRGANSLEHNLKIGMANRGIIPWNKGKSGVYSEETLKIKRDKAVKCPVLQYDLQMNFIKEWTSISEAARELQLIPTLISKCLHGKRTRTGEFIWKFKNKAA